MRAPRHLHPLVSFVAQPINHSLLSFEAKTKKPSWWFWGPNHQTVAAGFAQTEKPKATDFEAKLGETIDLGFEAKLRNPRSPSPCGRCRPHTMSADLSIVQPLSTHHVLDHAWSSAPGLLLLPWSLSPPAISQLSPGHHETSKCDSPHEIDRGRTTEDSWIWIQTEASQWLITIKPRNWPLDFSVRNDN
jgi:hypothetical protein